MYIRELFQAIHITDVSNYFSKLGILPEIEKGSYKCFCCNNPITLSNFRALTKHNGKLLFACDNDICVSHLAGQTKE